MHVDLLKKNIRQLTDDEELYEIKAIYHNLQNTFKNINAKRRVHELSASSFCANLNVLIMQYNSDSADLSDIFKFFISVL